MDHRKDIINKIKSKPPIFIIGCHRSGTSFLYRVLSETLGIGFGRDNTLFLQVYKDIDRFSDLNKLDNLKILLSAIENSAVFKKRFNNLLINNNEFISYLNKYEYNEIIRTIYSYWAYKTGNSRWGAKTPDYTGNKDFIYHLFPDVKIVHIIRDGRDVHLSFLERKWGPKDSYVSAEYWKKRVKRGSKNHFKYGKQFIEIKYEDLMETPIETFQYLIEKLEINDIDKHNAMVIFINQIVPKIKKNNIYKWKYKMREKDITHFEISAGNTLKKYGYETINKNFDKLYISKYKIKCFYIRNLYLQVKSGHLKRYIKKLGFQYRY